MQQVTGAAAQLHPPTMAQMLTPMAPPLTLWFKMMMLRMGKTAITRPRVTRTIGTRKTSWPSTSSARLRAIARPPHQVGASNGSGIRGPTLEYAALTQ
jgi:hypothetical protein